MKYFISYSHRDYDKAKCLHSALKVFHGQRVTGFLCSDRLIGKNYYTHIDRQLAQCDFLLFVATRNSVHSEWCSYEIGYINGRRKRTVPLLFDVTNAEMPDYLRLLLGARFDDKEEMQAALSEMFGESRCVGDDEIREFYSAFHSAQEAAVTERNLKLDLVVCVDRDEIDLTKELGKMAQLEQFKNDDSYELLLLMLGCRNVHLRLAAVEQLKGYFIDSERFESMLAQFSYVSYANIQELLEAVCNAIRRNRDFWPRYRGVVCDALEDRDNIRDQICRRIETSI